ncbi:hypothetical protein OFM39_29935, partial [Escherichia coli]|nr:hypothetical protein [Escherichia coli]
AAILAASATDKKTFFIITGIINFLKYKIILFTIVNCSLIFKVFQGEKLCLKYYFYTNIL